MSVSIVLPIEGVSAANLEDEISALSSLSLSELRELWSSWIGRAPKGISAGLLRRRLAYELQSRAHGRLNRRHVVGWDSSTKHSRLTPTTYPPSGKHWRQV